MDVGKTMKKIIWITIIIIVGICFSGYFIWKTTLKKLNSHTTTTSSFNGEYIDVHAHLISDRFSIDEAVKIIKDAKIQAMIIMQTPVDLSRIATPESHGIPQAAEQYPDQFAQMYQGEALVMLHQAVKKGSYTAAEEERFKSLAEEAAKSQKYVGFGELALRHYPQPDLKDPLQREARDITISGDHPWMLTLSDIGAKYNLPLDIHIEPENSTIVGLEKLISHNPETKIIFDHAGWYNTGEATADLFSRLMKKYPNFYASIKLRKPASDEQSKVAILEKGGKIKSEWLEVFQKYPDRFMIGTDVKFGLDTSEGKYEEILALTDKFLNALPADLASKIATKNAQKVFGL